MESRDEYINTLKGSADDVQAALEALAKENAAPRSGSKRRHQRVNFAANVPLHVELVQPGGNRSRFIVTSHDISEGGVGFLHGSFVHPNTQCVVTLKSRSGSRISMRGVIAHCRNLRGRVHYVGVRFNEVVDLGHFVEVGNQNQGYDPELVERAANRIRKLAIETKGLKELHKAFEQLGDAIRYPWS